MDPFRSSSQSVSHATKYLITWFLNKACSFSNKYMAALPWSLQSYDGTVNMNINKWTVKTCIWHFSSILNDRMWLASFLFKSGMALNMYKNYTSQLKKHTPYDLSH